MSKLAQVGDFCPNEVCPDYGKLCVRSTTQRRALLPASCSSSLASSPREQIWAVKPNFAKVSRAS